MKLLLLKILLQRRARDEGFTLPMVIALGLVMLLLGAVSITTANEENLTAITQNSRSDALAIAEIGIAQYREMLDKNRILTIYNRARWTSDNVNGVNVVGQTCDVISDTLNGWANNDYDPPPATEPSFSTTGKNYWRAVKLDETIVGKDLNNDGDSTDTDATIGWYKIVDYKYDNDRTLADNDDTLPGNDDDGIFSVLSDVNKDDDPLPNPPGPKVTANSITDENDTNDDGISDTRGILTVKSRSSDGSEAQIEVEIPIRINPGDMTNLAPALWIGDKTISATDLGSLTIGNDGKVVIKDQAVTTSGSEANGCRDFSDDETTDGSQKLAVTGTRPVISDSRDLPPITQIVTDVASARTALTKPTPSTINTPINSLGQKLFGATTHDPFNPDDSTSNCSNIKLCRYYYEFGSTTSDLTSPLLTSTLVDTDLLTDGIAKTTLLLNQPLTISAVAKNVKVGSTSAISSSDGFEIYVNGNNDITINATGNDVIINAFIHAPQSTLTINGSKKVTINGSVWVNDFVNNNTGSTGNVNISPDNLKTSATTLDKSYKFYRTTAERTPRPLTGSPTNWKTEEVN